MERYIGPDAHASSCTLGVVSPSGKRLGSHVVETHAGALIEVLREIPPRPARWTGASVRGCPGSRASAPQAHGASSRGPQVER